MPGVSLKSLGESALAKNLVDKGELPTVVTRIELDQETLLDLGAIIFVAAIAAVLLNKLLSK